MHEKSQIPADIGSAGLDNIQENGFFVKIKAEGGFLVPKALKGYAICHVCCAEMSLLKAKESWS
jgi:hypothetical protein